MNPKRKAALTLFFIIPFLTELLSGNMAAHIFFNPVNLLVMFLGYGVPILLIREMAIRWDLDWKGIFITGLAYGFFNEGIGAKTLLTQIVVPVKTFNEYGYFAGINLAWAAVIVVWHAFHSVLYPIFLTHYLYPKEKTETWLKNKTLVFLAGIVLLTGILLYFLIHPVKTSPIYFFVFAATMATLIFIAKKFKRNSNATPFESNVRFPAFFKGLAFTGFYFVSFLISAAKASPALFILFLMLWAIAGFYLLRKMTPTELVLFALGDYATSVLFSITSQTIERLIVVPIMAVAFIIFAMIIRKKARTAPSAI